MVLEVFLLDDFEGEQFARLDLGDAFGEAPWGIDAESFDIARTLPLFGRVQWAREKYAKSTTRWWLGCLTRLHRR